MHISKFESGKKEIPAAKLKLLKLIQQKFESMPDVKITTLNYTKSSDATVSKLETPGFQLKLADGTVIELSDKLIKKLNK